MALKDLIAQKSALTEQAIETIVSDYVRYDIDEKAIHFTPAAVNLSNKAKVLIYLVALQGWPFVSDDAVATSAKPADLEQHLAIPGGTLRPTLKDLKDRHLIAVKDGAYSVRSAGLASIKAELDVANGSSSQAPIRITPRRRRQPTSPPDQIDELQRERRKTRSGKGGNLSAKFEGWITAGFFAAPRTLSDVQKRFHEEGIIIPQTSIPGYLLKAVREERLARTEAEVRGRRVWVYQNKK
jgi:hypothetical protein